MNRGPKLSRARRLALKQAKSPRPGAWPEEITSDQRELIVFLNGCMEQGNLSPTTKEIADGCGWDMRHAIDVLRQARALGIVAHEVDGTKVPDPELLASLHRFGLHDASPEELDALVLIEQGAARLPAPERAGFLIGCGLQELREQGHSIPAIRKLVMEYLDAGETEMQSEDAKKGAAN